MRKVRRDDKVYARCNVEDVHLSERDRNGVGGKKVLVQKESRTCDRQRAEIVANVRQKGV